MDIKNIQEGMNGNVKSFTDALISDLENRLLENKKIQGELKMAKRFENLSEMSQAIQDTVNESEEFVCESLDDALDILSVLKEGIENIELDDDINESLEGLYDFISNCCESMEELCEEMGDVELNEDDNEEELTECFNVLNGYTNCLTECKEMLEELDIEDDDEVVECLGAIYECVCEQLYEADEEVEDDDELEESDDADDEEDADEEDVDEDEELDESEEIESFINSYIKSKTMVEEESEEDVEENKALVKESLEYVSDLLAQIKENINESDVSEMVEECEEILNDCAELELGEECEETEELLNTFKAIQEELYGLTNEGCKDEDGEEESEEDDQEEQPKKKVAESVSWADLLNNIEVKSVKDDVGINAKDDNIEQVAVEKLNKITK